jgi:hypothetical protein
MNDESLFQVQYLAAYRCLPLSEALLACLLMAFQAWSIAYSSTAQARGQGVASGL